MTPYLTDAQARRAFAGPRRFWIAALVVLGLAFVLCLLCALY